MPFIYSYSDSRTEPVDFHDFMIKFPRFTDDPSNAEIDALNEKRGRVLSLLLSQPNTKAVLDAIEAYLPLLIKFLNFAENHGLQERFKFKWISTLSASVRKTFGGDFEKPLVKSKSIYFEVIYLHMVYAFILTNMAAKKATPDCSEGEINVAVDCLCRAAGIFQFLSTSYGTTWAEQDGPPETTSASLAILADLALADAQQLVVLKAEKKKLQPASLMKLKAAVISKYANCDAELRRHESEYEDFGKGFKQHVEFVGKFLEASLLLQLAKDNAAEDKYGLAVAAITGAHNLFVECVESGIGQLKTESKPLLEESENLHSSYTKMNNHISFQPVPSLKSVRDEYRSTARFLVEPKPFVLPSSSSAATSSALSTSASTDVINNQAK